MTHRHSNIPVRKVRIRHPQTGEMGWTFRVAAIGTVDVEYVCKKIGRRMLIDPKMAAVLFGQIAEEIIYQVQLGATVDMGMLGFMRPAITGQGWAADEKDMTLHGTKGTMVWRAGKKTNNAFWDVGCTLDWVQRDRDRRRYKRGSDLPDDDDFVDDDDDFEDGYPLNIIE